MSDRDTDPMDKAYAEAAAMLDDDAARAARRARLLAAVAETPVDAESPPAPAPRPAPWRRGGWLVAAGVAGVSVLVAIQITQLPDYQRPTTPPAPSATPPRAEPGAADATRAPPPITPPARAASTQVPSERPPLPAPVPAPEARLNEFAPPPVVEALPAPPPPPPPPASAPAQAGRLMSPLERRAAPAAAPPAQPAARAQKPAASESSVIEELVVVTGSRARANADLAPPVAILGERLREAAAAGKSRQVSVLLSRGAPIDATDAGGETALMKAVQERRLDVVALLRRRGASLDLENQVGRSVRDMAAERADPALNKALGLQR